MKRLLASIVCITLLAASAIDFRPYASIPVATENVCLSSSHGIMAIAESTVVLTDDFKGTLENKWTKPLNALNIVTFKTGVIDGRPSMIWINEKAEDVPYDTETAIGSKPFSVKDIYELRLEYIAKSTVGTVIRKKIIHYDNFDFKICWYKVGEAKPFQEDTFDCETAQDHFVTNRHSFIVPQDAATATLHFGFGKPNFQKGQYFAIADFQLLGFGKNGKISPNASFETVPTLLIGNDFATGNDFAFDGHVPDGATLQFLFSYAPDDGGAPGAWSAWSPELSADGKLRPPPFAWRFKNNGKPTGKDFPPPPRAWWIKVKAVMTSNGKAAASIKSITVGKHTIGNWKTIVTPSMPDAALASVSPAKPDAPVKFRVITSSDINWKASAVLLDGKDAKADFHTNPLEADGVYVFTPQTKLAAGVHEINLHLVNMEGTTLDKPIFFFVGERRTASLKVTLRHDGMILVDGKPFFPIGFYYLRAFERNDNNLDTMFADLRSRGFNFGKEAANFNSLKPALEFAEAAARHDFKIQITASFAREGTNTNNYRSVADAVAAMRDCKSLIIWYIGDDTYTYNTVEKMRIKYDTVMAVDPDRIINQADVTGDMAFSKYKPFVNTSDIFSPEIYPVNKRANSHDECVYTAIAAHDVINANNRECANGPKGIVAILQYFASKEIEGNGWAFPTPEENRAMVYASIIRGAKGITWYSYSKQVRYHSAGATPGKLEDLTVVAKELEALYDVLTAEPIPQPAEPQIIAGEAKDGRGRVPVYILLKRSDKRTVLFTVNASVGNVTARVALPGVTQVTELFPTSNVKLAQPGVLDIPFTRHQVRVFELK